MENNKNFLNSSKKIINSVGATFSSAKNNLENKTNNILFKYDEALARVTQTVIEAFNQLVPDEDLEINKTSIQKNKEILGSSENNNTKNKLK